MCYEWYLIDIDRLELHCTDVNFLHIPNARWMEICDTNIDNISFFKTVNSFLLFINVALATVWYGNAPM